MFQHSSSSNYLDPTTTNQGGCYFDVPTGVQPPNAFFTATTAAASSDMYSSSSSLPSSYYGLHRSTSTVSIHPDMANTTPPPFYSTPHHRYQPPFSSSPTSSGDFFDFYDGPVRRVFSTGDLQVAPDTIYYNVSPPNSMVSHSPLMQGMNGMPVSAENGSQENGGSGNGKVGRYSAEERREKIEKYRSKRNQRNFHKKITYACRKTLADSRPRVRGRFARNGEPEMEMETEAETSNMMSCHESSHYSCNGSSINYNEAEWWQQMQTVLGTTEEDDRCDYDEDILATFVDVFSMNLLS